MAETVLTQAELEDVLAVTLTNLMVVVDYMTTGSDVPLDSVRDSLLKQKWFINKWIESH